MRYIAKCADFCNLTPTPNLANAEFIASARIDMPRLIEVYEHLQNEIRNIISDLEVKKHECVGSMDDAKEVQEGILNGRYTSYSLVINKLRELLND